MVRLAAVWIPEQPNEMLDFSSLAYIAVALLYACQAQGRRFETDHPLQKNSRRLSRLATGRKNHDSSLIAPSPIHRPNSAVRETLRAYVITYRCSRCDCCPSRSAVKVCLAFRTSWAMCASCARKLERGLRNRVREAHPP